MRDKKGNSPNGTALRPSVRVALLDEIRGFAVLCMVLHHAAFSFTLAGLDRTLFSFDLNEILNAVWFEWIRIPFVLAFMLISGICCNFSHSNIKRGLITFGCGLLVTLVTELFHVPIFFGILHFLGICMILGGLLIKPMQKAPSWLGYVFLFLSMLLYSLPKGQLGMPGLTFFQLPEVLYSSEYFFWLGFPSPHFSSADYFPLLPWCFVFFAGMIFGANITKKGWPDWAVRRHSAFLTFVGRHSLIIYLAHQPVFFGLFELIGLLVR